MGPKVVHYIGSRIPFWDRQENVSRFELTYFTDELAECEGVGLKLKLSCLDVHLYTGQRLYRLVITEGEIYSDITCIDQGFPTLFLEIYHPVSSVQPSSWRSTTL
jgi:hypothetical protein